MIPARLTQTDLAGLVGASRESVNKWVGFYERRGLIRCRGADHRAPTRRAACAHLLTDGPAPGF